MAVSWVREDHHHDRLLLSYSRSHRRQTAWQSCPFRCRWNWEYWDRTWRTRWCTWAARTSYRRSRRSGRARTRRRWPVWHGPTSCPPSCARVSSDSAESAASWLSIRPSFSQFKFKSKSHSLMCVWFVAHVTTSCMYKGFKCFVFFFS